MDKIKKYKKEILLTVLGLGAFYVGYKYKNKWDS